MSRQKRQSTAKQLWRFAISRRVNVDVGGGTATEYGDGDKGAAAFSNGGISVQPVPDPGIDPASPYCVYDELDGWQQSQVRRYELSSLEDHMVRRSRPRLHVLPGGVVAKGMVGCGVRPNPGGQRGGIFGFSAASRRRFRLKLMSVDWTRCDVSWCTLTFHDDWSSDPHELKKMLRRFMVNIERRFEGVLLGYIWRQEWQRRGAPHFHLLLTWKKGHRPQEAWFKTWCSKLWTKAIRAEGDDDHLRYGCRVINVEQRPKGGIGALLGYIVSDVGKVEQARFIDKATGEISPTGRCWGVRGDVPCAEAEVHDLTEQEWISFCARVAKRGREVGSPFLSRIHSGWAGFTVLGGVDEMRELIAGAGMKRVERERWGHDVSGVSGVVPMSEVQQAPLGLG